ncbi:MAG: sulfur carrier protein ThiS, partial [Burkholderiaceae bacterium]|nr:sulfur carrier protein ThiS [Burkholderiaceae bacterium]
MTQLETQAISVIVNGAPQRLDGGATVADLLARMDAAGKRVAVERNGEIVPK